MIPRSSLDLNLLRCFEALMAERNVTRAARVMGMSQPAMSHALRRLRAMFGDPLLVSSQGMMLPTEPAKQLQPAVRDLLARSDLLLGETADFDAATAGIELNLMTAEYVEYLLLPPLAARLKAEAPGVRLVFQTADRERAFERLEQGGVDFRLAWWPDPAATLHSKHIFSDPFVCIARKGHPDLRDGTIAEEAFTSARHVAIHPRRSGITYQSIVNAFARKKHALQIAMYVQSSMSLCGAVASTDFLACLPERFARQMSRRFDIEVVEAPFHIAEAHQSIYWHERTHRLASHRWFRNIVADIAGGL